MSKLIEILNNDEWSVQYDKENNRYRVSYFEEFHFADEIWFDAYKDKESCMIFPHTIGNITFYSKEQLTEWVEKQQKINNKQYDNWDICLGGFKDM